MENENFYDVVIVGGGISGANSAYTLRKKDPSLKILVLEAKERFGGRTQTIDLKCSKDNQTSRWDVGGQWVTRTQKNLFRLMDELKIDTYDQFDEGAKMLESNGEVSSYNSSVPCSSWLSWIDMLMYMYRVNKHIDQIDTINPYKNAELAAHLESQNFKDYLYSKSFTPVVRSIFTSNMSTIYGLELEQINALFALLYLKAGGGSIEAICYTDEGCAQEKRVRGGTQQIAIKALEWVTNNSPKEGSFRTMLSTAVVDIIQNEENETEPVRIVTQNTQTFERSTVFARKVISSIPINQYIRIGFSPELPYYKRNLFKFYQVGNYIKFIVTYKTPFWRGKGLSGEGTLDGSVTWVDKTKFAEEYRNTKGRLSFNKKMPTRGAVAEVFDGTNEHNEPALIGFIAAQAAVEWADQSPELRRREVLENLSRMYGSEAVDCVDYYDKNWTNEPYSNGCPAFSVVAPGCMKDYARGMREPFLNLHFCGTDTATEWQGYMDGAAESGERTANEVLYAMHEDNKGQLAQLQVDYKKTWYYHKEMIDESELSEEKKAARQLKFDKVKAVAGKAARVALVVGGLTALVLRRNVLFSSLKALRLPASS